MFPPSRIVCLTEETVETPLCSVSSIVSSGYVVRPRPVRHEKPRVRADISAVEARSRAVAPAAADSRLCGNDAKPQSRHLLSIAVGTPITGRPPQSDRIEA